MLLTFDQQKAIKPIGGLNSSNSVAQAKYEQLAAEVESLEIDQLLGSKLYQLISANPEIYADLLDGSTFEDCQGDNVTHKGLRYVIAYLNYAKWVGESYLNDTWTGITQKTRPDSERISSGDIKRIKQEMREIAFNAFTLVKNYIEQNPEFTDYWNVTKSRRIKLPQFNGIKNV